MKGSLIDLFLFSLAQLFKMAKRNWGFGIILKLVYKIFWQNLIAKCKRLSSNLLNFSWPIWTTNRRGEILLWHTTYYKKYYLVEVLTMKTPLCMKKIRIAIIDILATHMLKVLLQCRYFPFKHRQIGYFSQEDLAPWSLFIPQSQT